MTLGIRYIIRVKGSVKVELDGQWCKRNTLRFAGNARRRNLGRMHYCESSPQRLWITLSRARDKQGHWGIWYLVSNGGCAPNRWRPNTATASAVKRGSGTRNGISVLPRPGSKQCMRGHGCLHCLPSRCWR